MMPTMFHAETAPGLYRMLASAMLAAPEVPSRDGPTLEIPGPAVCVVSDPLRRMPLTPGRDGSPWVTVAEWPWLVAGRHDVAWLEPYLPRAKDFSDDGKTWRAGYGPRLRRWPGLSHGRPVDVMPREIDQLQDVVERLRASNGTRQAVMSLWDPAYDNEPGSKDYPCTNLLQAWVRDGRLNLHVVMRSNDLIWGLSGVNLYNWTMLQELLARCVGTGLGYYAHTATSLHVYARHSQRLHAMSRPTPKYPEVGPGIAKTTLAEYTQECQQALQVVEAYRGKGMGDRVVNGLSAPVKDWCRYMLLHDYLTEPLAPWRSLLKSIAREDWWLAAAEYLYRTGRITKLQAEGIVADRSASRQAAHALLEFVRCRDYVSANGAAGPAHANVQQEDLQL